MGWSICRLQRKAKCIWNWPGECFKYFVLLAKLVYHCVLKFKYCLLQQYIQTAASLEGLSPKVPLYKVTEGNEPCFFTAYFFSWDSSKATVCASIISLSLYHHYCGNVIFHVKVEGRTSQLYFTKIDGSKHIEIIGCCQTLWQDHIETNLPWGGEGPNVD